MSDTGGHHETKSSHGESGVVGWGEVSEVMDLLDPQKITEAISEVVPGYKEAAGMFSDVTAVATGGQGQASEGGGHSGGGGDHKKH